MKLMGDFVCTKIIQLLKFDLFLRDSYMCLFIKIYICNIVFSQVSIFYCKFHKNIFINTFKEICLFRLKKLLIK